MKNKKILFIKSGPFSHINEQVYNYLSGYFPDFPIDVIDIQKFFKKSRFPDTIYLTWHAITSSKLSENLRFRKIKRNMKNTSFFWNFIKNKLIEEIKANDYLFSIQTQSFFDGNIKKFPHYVYTDHTHLTNLKYPEFNRKMIKSKNWIEKEKKLYNDSSGIFSMSTHVKNSLLDDYKCDPNKVHCIYAGATIFNEDFNVSSDRYRKKRILFVGVEWERKGGPKLVEAFKLLLKEHPNAELYIVGCSPKINHPKIKIIGKVPLAEVGHYYKIASIFCMPSNREPFGIAYLEAMSYKLPIVALNIGALPDLIENGKNGYLAFNNEITEISDHLSFLLNNPELCEQMGEISYRKVKENYLWSIVIKKMTQIILSDLKIQSKQNLDVLNSN